MQTEDRRFVLKCRPNTVIVHSGKNKSDCPWRKKPTRKPHNGKLSENARRKLKSAIRWLIAASPPKQCYEKKLHRTVEYRINLATFTFKHNMLNDRKARLLLSKWLEMAKYRFSLEHYVWKAEPQKRGAIHFHLCSGIYMPYKELCYTWNRLLYKHGIKQLNSNSTDIHACHSVDNIESYLTEYLMNEDKHKGRRKIKGRLWGASRKLTQAGKELICISKVDKEIMQKELGNLHLSKFTKTPLPFLDFIDVYCLPEDFYSKLPTCDLKTL